MKRRKRRFLLALGLLLALLAAAAYVLFFGGEHLGPGQVTAVSTPAEQVGDRLVRQRQVESDLDVEPERAKQILFGDLHVHTTFSADAFMRSLPLVGGTGLHPPADACDFARYCSALDFFALTDHAESLTPRHWRETIQSVRDCNAVAGDPRDPDLVAFAGWEWSQVGLTPAEHYGHKNVIFRGLSDGELPDRPIAARGPLGNISNPGISLWTQLTIPIRDFANRGRYHDFRVYQAELAELHECEAGVDTRQLPADCREVAPTPAVLFEKLSQWGVESIVIPHGTTWGFYTPPGSSWDKQLTAAQSDPERQSLIEVYSGHGNSEEYREWRAVEYAPDGQPVCPEPTDEYEPCCWRAGELIRARCGDISEEDCQRRVAVARRNYLEAGAAGHLTVPGATVEDWGNCGQCTDCFNPAFNYRPGGAVQYILARGDFEDRDTPRHARFGLLASSDNHTGRPGTGYKELARMEMTEAAGPVSEAWREVVLGEREPVSPESRALETDDLDEIAPFRLIDLERQSSFFMTGGLVAVHAAGRDRDAIWEALGRREVYGTSGARILLWFDLVDESGAPHPMGSELALSAAPRFVVRAAGEPVQQPGCPEWLDEAVPAARIRELCLDECYHPSDQRRLITRIEVVRIRPQRHPDEDVGTLIEDPWRVLACPADPTGCRVEFDDPDFPATGRGTVYYVRAIQEPTPAINAGGLRCQDDECTQIDPCYGDYRTPRDEDCLSDNEERAWSSPIFVDYRPAPAGEPEGGAPEEGAEHP